MHVFDRTFMQEPGSRGSGSPALYTTQILSRVRLLRLIPWKSVPIAPRNLQPCASRLQPYASPGGACPIAPRLLLHWVAPPAAWGCCLKCVGLGAGGARLVRGVGGLFLAITPRLASRPVPAYSSKASVKSSCLCSAARRSDCSSRYIWGSASTYGWTRGAESIGRGVAERIGRGGVQRRQPRPLGPGVPQAGDVGLGLWGWGWDSG